MIPNPMLILAVVLAFVANGFYWNAKGSNSADTRWTAKIEKERADSFKAARDTERKLQEAYDAATKKQAARLAGVQRTLDTALDSLRDRPERPAGVSEAPRSGCEGANGAELSGAHGRFLARLAALAGRTDAGLEACYSAVDAVK
jgi:hypothetical protein